MITLSLCIELVNSHRTVVKFHERDADDEYESKKRIEIERNSSDEKSDTLTVLSI